MDNLLSLTEAQVISYVDKNPALNMYTLLDYLFKNVSNPDERTKLEIVGLSRLAGRCQIQGEHDRHKMIIEKLRKEYGLWSGK